MEKEPPISSPEGRSWSSLAKALPEDVVSVIDSVAIDEEALQRNAQLLRVHLPDNFDGVFRLFLAEFAVKVARAAIFEEVKDTIDKSAPGSVPILSQFVRSSFDQAMLSVMRDTRDFGEKLGQHKALNRVACTVLGIDTDAA